MDEGKVQADERQEELKDDGHRVVDQVIVAIFFRPVDRLLPWQRLRWSPTNNNSNLIYLEAQVP